MHIAVRTSVCPYVRPVNHPLLQYSEHYNLLCICVCIFLCLYCAYVWLEWRDSADDSSEAQQNGCSDIASGERIRHRACDHCKSIWLNSTSLSSSYLSHSPPVFASFTFFSLFLFLSLALTHCSPVLYYTVLSCPVLPCRRFMFLTHTLSPSLFFVVLSCSKGRQRLQRLPGGVIQSF